MSKSEKKERKRQPPCPTCGGSGQISFFQGESRFLLTSEECPACFGLGHLLPDDDTGRDGNRTADQSR